MNFLTQHLKTLFCLFVLVPVVIPSCTGSGNNQIVQINGETMGTAYMVKICVDPRYPEQRIRKTEKDIAAILQEINQHMSTYLPDSEISRFNKHRDSNWFPVSVNTAAIVKQAIEVSEATGGAYDMTIGSVVNAWGFGPVARKPSVPTEIQIGRALTRTGYQKIEVRLSPSSLKKSRSDIYCDLSGIAKGYAVDRISGYLDISGHENYVVEIGGEVRTQGRNDKNTCWQIGIAKPEKIVDVTRIISLKNASMATSGNYLNYFESGGRKYSHLIDPRTGYPVVHNLVSAAVVHKQCAYADAMATAISVLGPELGYDLAVELSLAAHLIVDTGDGYEEISTPEFDRLYPVREEPASTALSQNTVDAGRM